MVPDFFTGYRLYNRPDFMIGYRTGWSSVFSKFLKVSEPHGMCLLIGVASLVFWLPR